MTRNEPKCCDGFWGQDCQACPVGFWGEICSQRGWCNDGITGNGTCNCRGNVAGSSCEVCSENHQFGPNCDQTCACVHGKCDSGVDRPGTCSCNGGYGGALCDTVLLECAQMDCHVYSRCLNESGTLTCLCNPGYEGNGTVCNAIDPCGGSSNLCHQYAYCLHTGPATYNCSCFEGYTGDGRWCIPIDPCQYSNGGCPSNSTVCIFISPGKSSCDCKTGYDNQTSVGCALIDICGKYENTTCDFNATCKTVVDSGAIGVKCHCPLGSRSIGLKCYSDVLTEILNANETGFFKNQLNFAIEMLSSNYFSQLFHMSSFTVFVPRDDVFGELEAVQPYSSVLWNAYTRAHVVLAEVVVDFSEQTANSIFPMLGYNSSFKAVKLIGSDHNTDEDDIEYFAGLKVGTNAVGHLLSPPQWAVNGIFYVTDVLFDLPPFPILNYDASNYSVVQAIQALPYATNFLKFWKKSFLTQLWLRKGQFPFTLFLPLDKAFDIFTIDETKYLLGPGRNKLNVLLQHHFVRHPVTTSELASGTFVQTENDNLPINVSDSGIILVGKEQAKILIGEIPLKHGSYLYVIDKILKPKSFEKFIKNICHKVHEITDFGPCVDCEQTSGICPEGSNVIMGPDSEMQQCIYEVRVSNFIGQRLGCKHSCKKNVTTEICCKGFFGSDCISCPGPIHNPCHGNGFCEDGKTGHGVCRCYSAYEGSECSSCLDASAYGFGCEKNCSCLHGTCDNSVVSRGNCIAGSCELGWSGENCDRKRKECGQEQIACHQHATCVVLDPNDNTEECLCDLGYTGTGLHCDEFNPCVDSYQRGRCDINAICLYLGQGNTSCTCLEFYTGNGYTCEAINPCMKQNHGFCDQNAVCIFVAPGQSVCQCNPGFRGDGFICTEINLCVENNGGCHYRARCQNTGPGERMCTCEDGYTGDGFHCVGSLIVEIAEYPELSMIKHWVTTITSLQELLISVQYETVTAFLPRNDAWHAMSVDDFHFWTSPEHIPFLFRAHIVEGSITTSQLFHYQVLQSLLPTAVIKVSNVTDGTDLYNVQNGSTFHENIPTLGASHAKIILPDLKVYSGLLQIIELVLLPPRDVVSNHITLQQAIQNSTGTAMASYSVFLGCLNSSGIAAQLYVSNEPYTVFAVSNDFFNPDVINNSSSAMLSYYVVVGKIIRVNSIISGEHLSTLAGIDYQITLTKQHNKFFVNGQEIVQQDLRTQHGIFQGLSVALTPTKRYCDKTATKFIKSECLPCNMPFSCPGNSIPQARIHCLRSILHFTTSLLGCKLICKQQTRIPNCCANFYGPQCQPCPGGIGQFCSNNGVCSDGIKGNGTCTCSDQKFSGLACDNCRSGLYGTDCDYSCGCINGTCDDGKMGKGICICNHGFRGPLCDQLVDSNDGCQGKCDFAAFCVETSTNEGRCRCGTGYSGSGTKCSPINPCEDSSNVLCHRFASCQYAGPGIHICKCKTGYRGDGVYCEEINPCIQENFLSCDLTADCFHTGPNQFNCICKSGYTGDGKTCQAVNPCKTGNGGCHVYAKCHYKGPGVNTCHCLANYIGDGIQNCTGSIFVELQSDTRFASFIRRRMMKNALNSPGPITAFLPDLTLMGNPVIDQIIEQGLLGHIVGCNQYTVEQLHNISQLHSLSGKLINITSSEDSIFLNGNISVQMGGVLANGIFYVVDGLLFDSSTNMNFHKNMTFEVGTYLEALGAHKFSQMLQSTYSLDLLSDPIHGSWTLFIPTDEAFLHLSPHKQRQIFNDVREYTRYHMIRQSLLLPTDTLQNIDLTTMQGSELTVGCSSTKHGQIIINDGQSAVIKFEQKSLLSNQVTLMSSLFFINQVLEPPSLGGRCDIVSNITVDGQCSFCLQSLLTCPNGMQKIGKKNTFCSPFGDSPVKPVAGCIPICSFYNVTAKCCNGFYGKDCHPCPGGPGNACNNNGICRDGVDGNGSCSCKSDYKGYACELCEDGRFGRQCEQCKCSVHGICSDGIDNDGSCNCDTGWFGLTCSQKLGHSSLCNNSCVNNAVCIDDGSCQCKQGYWGNGNAWCELEDLCASQPCSSHAICTQQNHSVFCTCKSPYSGDGYVCESYAPCIGSNDSPHCHSSAQCVYVAPGISRCECLPEFHGDGINTCNRDVGHDHRLPISCTIENGGCSQNALCKENVSAATVKPFVSCVCMKGYVGDGHLCNGNIIDVLSSGLYSTDRFYQKAVHKAAVYMVKLRYTQNLTIFAPRNKVLISKRLSRRIVSRHVVSGHVYTTMDLSSMSVVVADSSNVLSVEKLPNGSIYINGVRMFKADIPAVNGVIHILDGVIPRKFTPLLSVTSTTKEVEMTNHVNTQTTTATVDHSGIPSVSRSPILLEQTTTTDELASGSESTTSSSGLKIGIAVAIIGAILIGVMFYYWRQRSRTFVFRPLSDRTRLGMPVDESQHDNIMSGDIGMSNPAYDSTAFCETFNDS
ncbi:stabilin-2-like isoform X2 [Clavelina lepadiformis]